MLAMPVARRSRETQNDHVRLKAADHPHHVAQNLIVAPLFEGFLGVFVNPKSIARVKNCSAPSILPGRQQLLRFE